MEGGAVLEIVEAPFERIKGFQTTLDAYRCTLCVESKEVFLLKYRLIVHLATVHGVRRVTKEQINVLEIR